MDESKFKTLSLVRYDPPVKSQPYLLVIRYRGQGGKILDVLEFDTAAERNAAEDAIADSWKHPSADVTVLGDSCSHCGGTGVVGSKACPRC